MPKTISELEAQRAKILKEIESKAGSINPPKQESPPSLKEWLSAAEEVMPENNNKTQEPPANNEGISYSSKILKTSHSNTASSPFFSWVILFTLFLTLAGVIYIVYNTLNKDISAVSSFKEESELQINELQENVNAIQKTLPAEAGSENYSELQTQLTDLKTEIESLKSTIAALQSQVANAQASNQVNSSDNQNTSNKLVNTFQKLEQDVGQKLAELTSKPLNNNADASNGTEYKKSKTSSDSQEQQPLPAVNNVATVSTPDADISIKEPSINEPNEIESAKVVTPNLPETPTAPAITIQKPASIKTESAPKNVKTKVVSEDEKWLQQQPAKNFILQLASMRSDTQIKRIKTKNDLDTKIITQTRNGKTNYILVTESLNSKPEAQKLAATIKKELGISPWIRQVEDITRLLP